MRSIQAFLLLFLLVPAVYGQEYGDTVRTAGRFPLTGKSNLTYGISMGSEFASFSGLGSAWNATVTPRFSLPVTKRFRLGGGISLSRTWYDLSLSQEGQRLTYTGIRNSATVFLSGQYDLSDRLTFSGTLFGTFPLSKDPLPYDPFRPYSTKNSKGVDLRVGYRVGKNAFIEAGFRYSDGYSPYDCHPFGGGNFVSDPFGSPAGYPFTR
ncbi:MAG TPA: hypothetical protein PKG48_05630 [Bacteroidales bacterium]|mgnify:CR=1 FL=1|nr:hypothetical protein [Bacteroidales bacterium]HPS62104.1 hypothetical protein [Bacteroidales bacterium]